MEHIKSLIKEKKYILLIIAALVLAEIFFFSKYGYHWLKAGGGMLLGFLIFLLARIFSRKSVGMGDVKLAAVLGWYLGGSLIWFDIVVSLSLAALYSIVQLILKKLNMKDSIPLAPFFSVGTILILLLGF